MGPKRKFRAEEIAKIRRLLVEKVTFPSSSNEAKSIRKELRSRHGFSSEKFVGRRLFTALDLDGLIGSGEIEIVGGDR